MDIVLGAKEMQMEGIILVFWVFTVGSDAIQLLWTHEGSVSCVWFLPSAWGAQSLRWKGLQMTAVSMPYLLLISSTCLLPSTVGPQTWSLTGLLWTSPSLNAELPSSVWCLLEVVEIWGPLSHSCSPFHCCFTLITKRFPCLPCNLTNKPRFCPQELPELKHYTD